MTLLRNVPGLKDVVQRNADRQLIKDLDELFEQAKNDRQQYEKQWIVNLAFFLDQQWVVFDTATRRLRQIKGPTWRVKMVVNFIKQQCLTKYAKLVQSRPQAKAQPASDEVEDKQQAEVCDSILEYLWTADGSEAATKRALLWAIVCGTGILQASWNKETGSLLTYPETTLAEVPDPVTGETTQQEVPHPQAGQPVKDKNGEPVYLGDVEATEISPFEFYPQPLAKTIKQMSWCFTQTLRSPEYVMEHYGVEVEAKKVAPDSYLEGQLASAIADQAVQARNGVLVKTFRQRSTKKYPEGRYVVYVDDQILSQGANPYPKAQIPFASFVDIPVPGRFWGDSLITSAIDPQRNLNKARSQVVENRNVMSNGRHYVPEGALDPGQEITNAPGEIVTYHVVPNAPEGGKPTQEKGSEVPESTWKDIQQSISEIRETMGIHEVSNAGIPAGVSAARAIGFLQEQDDLRLGPTAQAYEDAISQFSQIKLRLAKQFYEEPRTVRIVGKNNSIKVVSFYKDDIPDDVDVRVETGSSLPKSRVARQNFVVDLWKEKLIQDPRVAVRMLELGDIEGLYDDVNRDVAQAERENEAMKVGDGRQAHDFDNHQVHVAEHNKFRKGEEYETADPVVQKLFADHVASHQQLMAASAPVSPLAALAGKAAGHPETAVPPTLTSNGETFAGAPPGPAEGSPQAFAA